ncbi:MULTISPECIES: LysR family transcriptional regulator [Pseudomonas]|uniref:LysR family transcriptional regulator n=1 Tax=Pseudomonas TaxID=286 RepID=UPI000D8761A1|nr:MULTISPECIES: LysR family transcriptional regulator [Pseudomonas]MBH3472684.1 LysR family transcriptional regulator [Pseudomonas putida]MDG9887516.1 LysR family transcriptional regulator [Pseudomonas juntendi]PYC09369.1 LysR family transcriptional regulator [Pseudomonas sp. MB-090624]
MLNRMELIRIFSVAAQSTTFRDAATRLGTSPQTVTRAIKELERTLGELLFHRSTRQVHVTAFGAKLAVQARETLDGVDQLFIANSKQEVKGAVGITAPHAIGKLYLIEFLKPLMLENPGLSIDLSLDDQLTDAVANKIDIGIRVGAVRDRRYIARTVAHVDLKIVAAPSLLDTVQCPGSIEDLKRLPLSMLIDRNNGRPWPWVLAEGQTFLPASPAFTCDDPETEREIVLAGIAFGQMPGYLAEPYLSEGRLVEVMQHDAPPPSELIMYRPQSGPVAPRVRLVYDHLVNCFSDPRVFAQSAR